MTHDELDYSDSMNMFITKVKSNGVFTHWESTVYNNELRTVAEYTGPTYRGVVDEALAYIMDEYPVWVEEDANDTR